MSKITSFTYFIKNKRSGNIKIGRSVNPSKRICQLKTSTPDPLILLFKIDEKILSERQAHIMFRHSKILREWFRGTPDIYQFINDNLEQERLEKMSKRQPTTQIENIFSFNKENDFFAELKISILSKTGNNP